MIRRILHLAFSLVWMCAVACDKVLPIVDSRDYRNGALQAASSASAKGPNAENSTSAVGYLVLTVRWPTHSGGEFGTATIPANTTSLHIQVSKGELVLGEKLLLRPQGQATSSATFDLDATNGLAVLARAYLSASPTIGVDTPLAEGTVTGINILPSRVSTARLVMASIGDPAVLGFKVGEESVSEAGRGAVLSILGKNFGSSADTIEVNFNGTPGSNLSRKSDTLLEVTIPADATTGNVTVSINGKSSSSVATLWILSSIKISASKESWDLSGADQNQVLAGRNLKFAAVVTFALKAGEAADTYGSPPVAAWVNSNPAAGTIGLDGLFTAARIQASTSISAKLGSISSNVVKATTVVVTKVEVAPESFTINLAAPASAESAGFPSEVQLSASVANSAAVTISGVKWTSSDPSKAKVDANGLVTAVGRGDATISATSVDDDGVSGSAAIIVLDNGVMDMTIF